ncbi:TPA: hypothetical protein ACG9HT_002676 [Enterococcus faecium]|nr:hypothetical protein [Enterococcus faecium]MCF8622651.1 hypothetical protein [Enterococcus faecium]MCU2079453.1 hypothetical protein [Enterococcus faecium]HAZ9465583.1 hypothetical protein [Enterococcus faecium]HBB7223820.1 hypothetical protein [Enterococcus faecium]HBK7084672.1 hypothetical protein [Enterococcus faecium]
MENAITVITNSFFSSIKYLKTLFVCQADQCSFRLGRTLISSQVMIEV